MIYFSSDWHFNHDREFIWGARGYNNIQEMNEDIIKKHNLVVCRLDDVFVLGDLMLGDLEKGLECVRQLNGRLHIIRGNHDTDTRWEAYKNLPNVVEVTEGQFLKYGKYHFYLTHFPCMTGNLEKESLKQMTLNLYGHTHQAEKFYKDIPYMYNVGVDAHSCYPVWIEDIINQMNNKVEECKNFL